MPDIAAEGDGWAFQVPVYLGEIDADDIRVELYADPAGAADAEIVALARGAPVAGAMNGYTYAARVTTTRPPGEYTVRILPRHPEARVPAELPLIFWQD